MPDRPIFLKTCRLTDTNIGMRPSEALLQHREAIREAVLRCRVANPRVFGSVLHGTDTEDSDLDILVDAVKGTTLLDLCGLNAELEQLLGIRVDVKVPEELPARWRHRVVGEARPI